MSARHKLNSAYLQGAALVSGFIGLLTQSFGVFIVCFVVLAAMSLYDGSIRVNPRRR